MSSHYFPLGVSDIFNTRGRINRLTFFMYSAVATMIGYGISYGITTLVSIFADQLGDKLPWVAVGGAALIIVFYLYVEFCIAAKRLHDLGLPALSALVVIAPLALILAMAVGFDPLPGQADRIAAVCQYASYAIAAALMFIPGTKGSNRYGEHALRPQRYKPHVLTE